MYFKSVFWSSKFGKYCCSLVLCTPLHHHKAIFSNNVSGHDPVTDNPKFSIVSLKVHFKLTFHVSDGSVGTSAHIQHYVFNLHVHFHNFLEGIAASCVGNSNALSQSSTCLFHSPSLLKAKCTTTPNVKGDRDIQPYCVTRRKRTQILNGPYVYSLSIHCPIELFWESQI